MSPHLPSMSEFRDCECGHARAQMVYVSAPAWMRVSGCKPWCLLVIVHTCPFCAQRKDVDRVVPPTQKGYPGSSPGNGYAAAYVFLSPEVERRSERMDIFEGRLAHLLLLEKENAYTHKTSTYCTFFECERENGREGEEGNGNEKMGDGMRETVGQKMMEIGQRNIEVREAMEGQRNGEVGKACVRH